MDYKDGEHLGPRRWRPEPVITFDIEAYPEPKALSEAVLTALADKYGGWTQAAGAIGGVSEGFIRQNSDVRKRNRAQTK